MVHSVLFLVFKKMEKRVITFGEIMLRLSTPSFSRFTQAEQFNALYAGSEANVASSLSLLGIPAAHVTRFPDNDLGHAATQCLRKYGVATDYIIYGDERLGIYFLENGVMQRSSRIIYDRFDSAFAHLKPGMIDWDSIMKEAAWFHWTGITPAISQGAADVCYEAIQSARKHNVRISGDINYRRNLWQYGKSARDVMPRLIESTDVVVAGITDMENCVGISGDSYEDACKSFIKTNPNTKKIATTIRESISSSHNRLSGQVWNGKALLTSSIYDMTHIVDRIGAGDAFMAGWIYGMMKKMNDQQAIEFAVAAGVLKHAVEGDINQVTVGEIEALVKGENVGKLLR
jgi:2-dehydro-3-deoxygluconokinase